MKRSPGTHFPPALQTAPGPQYAGAFRRRVRSPGFLSRKRVAAAARAGGGRRSGPGTPLLRWKFDDADATAGKPKEVEEGRRRKTGRNRRNAGEGAAAVSARRLAAGIWQLRVPEVPGQMTRSPAGTHFQPFPAHPEPSHLCNLKGADGQTNPLHELPGPVPMRHRRNGMLLHQPSIPLTNHAMERATKWDPGSSKASEEVFRFYGRMRFLENQQETAASVVLTLRTELEQARSRINELEDECQSSKKTLDHFLEKLTEEKDSWRRREHEKIRAVISSLKDELLREKKNRQRLEVVNSKFVNELAEAKLSAKRYMQEYEKERKNRELMEEVCDELAKEVGDEKAEFDALKNESMKIREEVEEERRMLQMAEVWREERVQMKLIDAKLLLEEKYVQLSSLQADLLAFLGSHSGETPRVREIQEAELLVEAVNSVNIHDKEFSYVPPRASEDIFSVFENLQPAHEPQEREIEACQCSPESHASKLHTVSPAMNGFDYNPLIRYSNGPIERIGDMEDDSGWETVSHGEENGSGNSHDGSEPSVNGAYVESKGSTSGTDFEDTTGDGKSSSEISEVYSANTKLSRKKGSSITKRWRSSFPKNGETCKVVTVETESGNLTKGRPSTGSNGVASPNRGDVGLGSPNLELSSSPDIRNPHITRGMKGWIEWPKGVQKNSLKDKLDKLFEVRKETHKVQLRQVLRQKS